MLEIFLYAFGVMYTPGPVNLIGFNLGLNGVFEKSFSFFVGVGVAMLSLFLIIGYTGQAIVSVKFIPYIAIVGSAYIVYLAVKIFRVRVDHETDRTTARLGFRDGFLLQFLNPKGMIVILPITGILFPAAEITGISILILSVLLSILGGGAPGTYSVVGALVGRKITKGVHFEIFNKLMGTMLFVVAMMLLYEHSYLSLAAQ